MTPLTGFKRMTRKVLYKVQGIEAKGQGHSVT